MMRRGFASSGDDEDASWQLLFGVGLPLAGLLIALVTFAAHRLHASRQRLHASRTA